jgi:hypothetical protein
MRLVWLSLALAACALAADNNSTRALEHHLQVEPVRTHKRLLKAVATPLSTPLPATPPPAKPAKPAKPARPPPVRGARRLLADPGTTEPGIAPPARRQLADPGTTEPGIAPPARRQLDADAPTTTTPPGLPLDADAPPASPA